MLYGLKIICQEKTVKPEMLTKIADLKGVINELKPLGAAKESTIYLRYIKEG